MSDTDGGGAADDGGFDKEAEKEKLREQLEREEEQRRSTEHMSELLLKGATMTNKHCDQCGDPLFRHEGREFCPTCGRESGAVEEGEATAEASASQSGPGDDATGRPIEASNATGDASADDLEGARGASTADDTTTTAQSADSPGRPDAGSSSPERATGGAPAATGGDLGDARAALERKLAALARQAEATEDVGRVRELLAATREAAEALAALESVGR